MTRLIECVPNFSEGRDPAVIRQITDQVETVDGVKLLDVDPGQATNRTVVTFVGPPEQVIEAAVRAIAKAGELIDMSKHEGEHPRFGATDVCPLVPVCGVTMEETVDYARELARRLGEELGLTIFCYEHAATCEERRNLASVRSGEYEGLAEKLGDPAWQPDHGPAVFNARSGATAVGARDFLIAYNINLNTTSTRRANAIAFDVREKGRMQRQGDPLTGEILRDDKGEPLWTPGSLRCVKAIGWFIEEYGVAQISMNLTDLSVTPMHAAFDEVCERARDRGVRVTGSELVGMVPLQAMLDAGRHFLRKQKRSTGVSDAELIKIAVRSLGLDELGPFDPRDKIIEYRVGASADKLCGMSLRRFIEETASESPAPGGGSVAATLGALGAALGTMVANLSAHKRGWDERWKEFSDQADQGKALQGELTALIDEDTRAFDGLMAAMRLPSQSAEDAATRKQAITEATRQAIEVPLRVMQTALASMDMLANMAEHGLAASVSDAGVGALCARAAVAGAMLNVQVNAQGLGDHEAGGHYLSRGKRLLDQAIDCERKILALVENRIDPSGQTGDTIG